MAGSVAQQCLNLAYAGYDPPTIAQALSLNEQTVLANLGNLSIDGVSAEQRALNLLNAQHKPADIAQWLALPLTQVLGYLADLAAAPAASWQPVLQKSGALTSGNLLQSTSGQATDSGVATSSVVSASSSGGPTPWATGTAFGLNELVSYAGTSYICATPHTAGSTFDYSKFAAASTFPALRSVGSRSILPSGLKLHGACISIKPSMGASSDPWSALWLEWDWYGWIKPQIDAAISLGCNAIQFGCGMSALLAGTLTQATYQAQYEQFLDYLRSNRLYHHANIAQQQNATIDGTPAQFAAQSAVLGAILARYPDVCLTFDLYTEAPVSGGTISAFGMSYITAAFPAIRAAAPNIAVTISTAGANLSVYYATLMPQLDQYVDFWSSHFDFTDGQDISNVLVAGNTSKPFMLAEFAAQVGGYTTQQRQNRYQSIRDIMAVAPYCMGAFAWSIFDQDYATNPNNQFGLYESDVDSGATVSYGTNTVTDTSKAWTTNQWAGATVLATTGSGLVATGTVASNTATTLTLSAAWGTQPPNGTEYTLTLERSDITEIFKGFPHVPSPYVIQFSPAQGDISIGASSAYDWPSNSYPTAINFSQPVLVIAEAVLDVDLTVAGVYVKPDFQITSPFSYGQFQYPQPDSIYTERQTSFGGQATRGPAICAWTAIVPAGYYQVRFWADITGNTGASGTIHASGSSARMVCFPL